MLDGIKQVAILGSTGNIGCQTLCVIAAHPSSFRVCALSAYHNADLLIEQARSFGPRAVCIADESLYGKVKAALSNTHIRVYSGVGGLDEMVSEEEIDVVVGAMVGFAGLRPILAAIRARHTVALANKETLVVAGELVTSLAKEYGVKIIPVDSEHSAIFQCLVGEKNNRVEKLILTASGGPFLRKNLQELHAVTAAEALRHPNWDMGEKVTIDSASLMNKGFEVMEAKWLFGMHACDIEVVIHPQSIIHSMVQFADGSIKAQLGVADMRIPIQYALSYPHRLHSDFPRLDWSVVKNLTFEHPDMDRFRNLGLVYEALKKGGNMPCVLNAANEVVVRAFLEGRISFLGMSDVIEEVMLRSTFIPSPNYEDYVSCDAEVRRMTKELVDGIV